MPTASRNLPSSRRQRGPRQAVDRSGRAVGIGTKVRVIEIADALRKGLPSTEWRELQAMIGATFKVYEIDEHGAAWVETPLVRKDDGYLHNHSVGLDPHEMEVVSITRRRRRTTGCS